MRRSLLCLVILAILIIPKLAVTSQITPNLLTISQAPLIVVAKVVSLKDAKVVVRSKERSATKTTLLIERIIKDESGYKFIANKEYVFDVLSKEKLEVGKRYMLNMKEFWKGIWSYLGSGYGVFTVTDTNGKQEIVNKYMNRGLMNGVKDNVTKLRVLAKDPAGTALDAKDDATTRVVQGPIELDNVIRVINKTDMIRKNMEFIKRGANIKITPVAPVNGGAK